MFHRHLLAACILLTAGVAWADEVVVRTAESGQPARREERSQLTRKLADLRARLAEDPRVKEAKAAVERAEKAFEEKVARDPAVAEATRAEQAARAEVAKAEQAAADTHPRVQEHRRALVAAQARAAELDLQRRVEEIRAEHLRHEAGRKPEHRDLRSRAHLHAHGKEALAADPRLAAARKALDEANAALEAKTKQMPEFTAREQARKAFDAALAASQPAKDAATARRALDEKIAADERVATQTAKVKAAGEAQAAHRKTIEDLEKKVREAAGEVAAKDPRVTEAGKAVAAARDRVRKTLEERTAAERNAREAARSAWREKFETVIAENPEAKALMAEMRGLEERLRQLRDQMGELRRPVSQVKP
jgi:colicin import membrane protein